MMTFKLLAAAALSAFVVSQASAQPVVQDPALVAFYYPYKSLGLGYSMPLVDVQATASRHVLRHRVSTRRVRSVR